MDTNIESTKSSLNSIALSKADQDLSKAVKSTLEKSLLDVDELTHAKLMRARKDALKKNSSTSLWLRKYSKTGTWVSLAAAASMAAVIILPNMSLSPVSEPMSDELSYLGVDPQWLEDMEMLEVMEGGYDETKGV